MSRAPFQVLCLPYLYGGDGNLKYAVLLRPPEHGGYWQGIAGGGQGTESPLEAARREAAEEAGIPPVARFLRLDSLAMIPVYHFRDAPSWGAEVYVICEYAFGVECATETLLLSDEHTSYAWLSAAEAQRTVRWDSNRTALWELNERLTRVRQGSPPRWPLDGEPL